MTWRLLVAALLAGTLSGCAVAGFNATAFHSDVAHGRLESALARLERFGENDVAALLDRGLLLQALKRYDESNAVFDRAEILIDDLYTRSLSREALSLLTSDLAREYRASAFEVAYLPYFRSWNYLERGDVEGTLVEARRIGERLDGLAGSASDPKDVRGRDPFLRYFSGLLFEWGGEINDAYVAYKQAHEAVDPFRSAFGVEPPPDLGERLVKLAGVLGFEDEKEHFARLYGIETRLGEVRSSLVVIVENGTIGGRATSRLTIPIYSGESSRVRDDIDGWSVTLADRAHAPRRGDKLDFLLTVATPRFVDHPPLGSRAKFHIEGRVAETRVVSPLSSMARRSLDEAMGGILVRTIARALAKYFAKETAKDTIGEGAGLLVNLLGVVSEQAETRSWRSLPYEIRMAAVDLDPGSYEGELRVLRRRGGELEPVRVAGIRVPPGGIAFARHRAGL